MGYKLEAGDEVRVEIKYGGGGEEELTGVVHVNTAHPDLDEDDYLGSPKAKLHTGGSRASLTVLLDPTGAVTVKPRFNSNGQSREGILTDLELLSVTRFEAIGPDGDTHGVYESSREALEAAPAGGHSTKIRVDASEADR